MLMRTASTELLADLVSDGLAIMQGETVNRGVRAIEIIRVADQRTRGRAQSRIERQKPTEQP